MQCSTDNDEIIFNGGIGGDTDATSMRQGSCKADEVDGSTYSKMRATSNSGALDSSSSGSSNGSESTKGQFSFLIKQKAALQVFVEEWRGLFLAAVEPRHLPVGWRKDRAVWS
mmetsp:Transcript_27071/g.55383  ORF Transcript_27071/g.55383 Transcript_27071/m.55383 type:complete len:113 (-) Transcript_27071:41-379(-)